MLFPSMGQSCNIFATCHALVFWRVHVVLNVGSIATGSRSWSESRCPEKRKVLYERPCIRTTRVSPNAEKRSASSMASDGLNHEKKPTHSMTAIPTSPSLKKASLVSTKSFSFTAVDSGGRALNRQIHEQGTIATRRE